MKSSRVLSAIELRTSGSPCAFRLAGTLCGIVVALAATGMLQSARADDRITLERSGFYGRLTVTGSIEDYTGEHIRLRIGQGDNIRSYPASEVVEIETAYTEPHTEALVKLARGQVAAAIGELESALKKEPRAWVRREILALLVRSARRQGDLATAGARFLLLIESDPTTLHFGVIPLLWADEPIPITTRADARGWLEQSTGDPARLMGASLLLEDSQYGAKAVSTLRELASSADERVRRLARMQGWRRELASEAASSLQIENWRKRIDELPVELRAGPMYLLGRAYAGRHDYELAAATLLWLPLSDDHDFPLTARACLEAGLALDKIGQRDEARTLFREVIRRFHDTPWVGAATRQLLAEPGSGRDQPADPEA